MLFELKSCQDIYELSDLLEIPAKILTYILYVIPEQRKYTEICLSKKAGGTRIVHAPIARLKELQAKLAYVLYECQEEIDQSHGKRRSFGFERGLSILDNAELHRRKRWVFNTDLIDFFPSINFGRVISFFKKNKDFSLHPKIATYIAQIACFQGKLPQGAPSSPVIANLICGSLDYRLAKFARENRCNYSRYADDITFSTNLKTFPDSIAEQDESEQGWRVADLLEKIIDRSGFELNHNKSRMSFRRNRQMVTGLVVNEFPNVRRSYYKGVRAAIDHLIKDKPAYIPRFCDPFRSNCEDERNKTDIVEALSGQISFCAFISDRTDGRSQKEKFFNPSAIFRSYADLVFYKYFASGGNPLIITEGESDVLYIKSALLKANASIPNIVEYKDGEKNEILIDFFNFPRSAARTVGLAGGTGNINIFLQRFKGFLDRCDNKILNRRAILLLDNDDGLKDTAKLLRNKFKVEYGQLNNDPYKNISSHCSVVKTPHIASGTKSAVEDFLDQKAISVKLDDKTFSRETNYDTSKHFGKYILSNHIYTHIDKYDFASFMPIIRRLQAAVEQS
ncbi:retron Ec67 family RNA-directed DNA polymerase/endonuclease [Erythrobacter sp. HA6-11]